MSFKQRLAPFLVLLEARYLPLLLLALPQSYTVAIWLTDANKNKPFAEFFAVVGALAFEASYVGAIAWTEHNAKKNHWMWITAASALIFSVLVAVRVYFAEEFLLSLLHAGFPIVAFFYTMLMHSASVTPTIALENKPQKPKGDDSAWKTLQSIPAPAPVYAPPSADGGGSAIEQDFNLRELLEETEPLLVAAVPAPAQQQATTQTQPSNLTADKAQKVQAIRAMKAEGATWDAIAQAVNVSKRTAQLWYASATDNNAKE